MKCTTSILLLAISSALTSANPSPNKSGGCSIIIAKLGIKAQPLFLKPGTSSQWPVDISGAMELDAGDTLELFCPSKFVNPSGISGSQTATCVSESLFKIGKTDYNITDVTCKDWPKVESRNTNVSCIGGDIVEIGFPVDSSRFVKQFDACFNANEEVTYYVKYTLSPENQEFQRNVERPTFAKGGLFGRRSIEKLYTISNQKKLLTKVIGKLNAEKYIKQSDTCFLSRGHMAAKADFITANEQRATFQFVNVAPQWQSFNAGNWLRVEDNTRKWVAKRNMSVNCWTGTYGIITFQNEKRNETPIYLDYDKNNTGLIPVPMLYYRIITEPSTKRGVVLVGVNNPFLTIAQIKKDYILCKDVSDKLDFLTWKKKDLQAGYSYACEVKDFVDKIPNLPKFDIDSLLK